MRHLRTRDDEYAFCCDYGNSDIGVSHIYRNVKCLTENGGQLESTFKLYPDCTTLRDLFQSMVDSFSGYPAFGSETGNDGEIEWITYAEFSDLVVNFAYAMKKMGIKSGQHVGLFVESSTWFALAQWALAYLGAVMVPIKDNEDKTVIPQIIRVMKTTVLILSERTIRRLQDFLNGELNLKTIIVACDGRRGDAVQQQVIDTVNEFHIDVRMLPTLVQCRSRWNRLLRLQIS